ncbi:uncharacterized protein LOC129580037, partial [Sitodiplosis mosellana]|uniref:uncharacterized protein LOC129580037 n=1 Tax=Sitodiplosis mosellana TaxID=263140 RepID=UPI002444AAFD
KSVNSNNDIDTNTSTSNTNNDTNIANESTSDSYENDPALECIHDSSQTEMKSISIEEYRRILNATVELYKATETIQKLELLIQKKDDKIKYLETQLEIAQGKRIEGLSQEQYEVLSCLIHPMMVRNSYLPSVRKFCLRMVFHSTAAYNALRNFFNNNLPAHRTIQRWLHCIDATPGITQMALDAITKKVEEYTDRNKQLYLCIIHDEMSMKQHVAWSENENLFKGFATTTNASNEGKRLPVAKDVLVYMAVGPDFRIAVAYFLLNGLEGIDRAVLSKEVIRSVENTGAVVISLTGDGLSANITSYEFLGSDFKSKKPYFPSPTHPEREIYIIYDPPHMLKIIRKDFSTRKLYHKDELLNWNLLSLLAAKQDGDNFGLGNQLTQRHHINWNISPMTVRYAAETMSNSVADALEQLCEDKYADFEKCESTVQLIRLCNNVFDALNYGEGKKTNNQFKQPICESTLPAFLKLFEEFRKFVDEISIEIVNKNGTSMKRSISSYFFKKSNKFVGFCGFLQNMISVIGIYTDYMTSPESPDKFFTFQFSQDSLETYFSLIRSSLGASSNPNAQQFMSAYRKLLICMPHMSSKHTNCNYFDVSNILTVPSTQMLSTPLHIEVIRAKEIEIDTDYQTLITAEMDPYENHIIAYVSSNIEASIMRKIKAQSVSACQDCLAVFTENNKISDSFIARKNQSGELLAQPCCSTQNIILVCEAVCKILQEKAHVEHKVVTKTIFNCLDIEDLYQSTLFSTHHDKLDNDLSHKDKFIFDIVLEYMRMKSMNIGRRITDEEWLESMKRRKARRTKIVTGR